ncbi:MAG: 4Fe-4S dicluster domain-containing protein, partial [Candidatus Coatesbacteria bacterium]|nr:4Fe-4S dicluster domain-containing protein [Candidatus Coatesbacteria bacterium]
MAETQTRDLSKIRRVLDKIFDMKEPPVARTRLLSTGMEIYNRLHNEGRDLSSDKGCIGCGNCVDSCPVLRREPERLERTAQRTSMALESIVGEDCEQCYSCALACPQTDLDIKQYIVDKRVTETLPKSKTLNQLDRYFAALVGLIFGLLLGILIAW